MPELLHAWAVAPAAIGTCCLAADRGRVRMPELMASMLMMLAMLDAALTRLVAPVYWAAFLVVGAMGLAALRTTRRSRHSRSRNEHGASKASGTGAALHTPLGMIVMAALMLGMNHGSGGTATAGAHQHGIGTGLLMAVLIAGAAAYSAASFALAVRRSGWSVRAEYTTMGAATSLMAIALLV